MIGARLANRYELTSELGRGGMGVVYQAHDPVLGRDVAVKMIPPDRLASQTAERFEREARLVGGMDHPSIVPIYDFGEEDGALFFVMPWLRGTVLRELVEGHELVLGDVLEIGIQAAEALAYSHARGVVHRDVKPSNIMVDREGPEDAPRLRVRVTDFGLAQSTEGSRLTRSGGLVGTLANLSPEQVAGTEVDARSDLYSLGTVLFECLAGEPVYSGGAHTLLYRIAHEQPPSLRGRGMDVDPELDDLILTCLSKRPGNRPQSGSELSEALAAVREHLRDCDPERLERPAGSLPGARVPRTQEVPLVGRQAEMAELQERLRAAVEGECQLVLISGEAGSGKSRIVAELCTLVRARGIRVASGHFAGREEDFPYQGLCELVLDFFRSERGSSTSRVSQVGSEEGGVKIADLAADLVACFPMLAEVAELRAAAAEARASEPQLSEPRPSPARSGELYELLAQTLIRLADDAPVVLVLEGLHDAAASIEALRYLARRLAATPTLIVATYRREEVPRGHPVHRLRRGLADDPRCATLDLKPLDELEIRRLIESQVGGGIFGDELVRSLAEATEGNPFFLVELVRSLAEGGGLTRDGSGFWDLSEQGLRADALPRTVRQTVERRLERLGAERRELLTRASVLGRAFEVGDLEALLAAVGNPPEREVLDALLDRLIDDGLLREERKRRGDHLSFASPLLRDVLYGSLPRRRRRSLHRHAAEYLEKHWAGRLERVYPQLVHHFYEADAAQQTVRYGLELARHSLAARSSVTAARTARLALEMLGDNLVEDEARQAGELRQILAEAHRRSGAYRRAFAEASRAAESFAAADLPMEQAAAELLAAEAAWQGRRVDEAHRAVDKALEIARQGASQEVLSRALPLAATLANLRGETGLARRLYEEAEAACAPRPQRDLPEGGTLVTALPHAIGSVDPAELESEEGAEISATLFETLLCADPDGNLLPGLCRAWEVSADGLVVVLTLRSNQRFSDGTPLDATAVKHSLERLAARRTQSQPPAILALADLQVDGPDRLICHLNEPLPIFPALLTDPVTAIVREVPGHADQNVLVGSGPFRLAREVPATVVGTEGAAARQPLRVERNPRPRPPGGPRLAAIEWRVLDAPSIAAALRSGEIDLGRNLLPHDLDLISREPRFHGRLAERPKSTLFFVLFNSGSPQTSLLGVRRALAGVLPVRDLVWRALGRLASPALGWIPPGLFGHDPGRRQRVLAHEEAQRLLSEAGVETPLRLRAAIHPLLQDRYGALTAELLQRWSELGVEVESCTPTVESYRAAWTGEDVAIDVLLGRVLVVYDDPDAVTYHLFNSQRGLLRRYHASAALDDLLSRARSEAHPPVRQALYSRVESHLADEAVALPLFHEIDVRVAGPGVHGLKLDPRPPFVRYGELAVGPKSGRGGSQTSDVWHLAAHRELHVAQPAGLWTLDPSADYAAAHFDMCSAVFETLTRLDAGARTIPWLAEVAASQGGTRYDVRLREVRFHDGRRLSARDVRDTFERVLRDPGSRVAPLLLPIRGAREMHEGRAGELAGLRVVSAGELVLELEEPLAFFPAMLAHPGLAIVPEGAVPDAMPWTEGVVGSGPYRVVRFVPGERLDLDRHPQYWRQNRPRSSRLTFHLGLAPEQILADFRSGRLALASDLPAAEVEALRRDPSFEGIYHESPRLSTVFLALNPRGALAELETRRALARTLDARQVVRATLGSGVTLAEGLIPPGLLGAEANQPSPSPPSADLGALRGLRLRTLIHHAFRGPYATLWEHLGERFAELGIQLETASLGEAGLAALQRGEVDLVALRWTADYPDSDAFAQGLLHSREGFLGAVLGREDLDRRIAQGRREIEPALRHGVYREVERYLAIEELLVPLFHEQIYRFSQPSIEGLELGMMVPEVRYEELMRP